MEIEEYYVIKLTRKEACALSALLGERNQTIDIKAELTAEESAMLTNLYFSLPKREDDDESV